MKRNSILSKYSVAIALFVMAAVVSSAPAQSAVQLQFTPADTMVSLGTAGRLSVMLNNLDKDVRTLDLYVSYDTTVVSSLGGGAGAMFSNSGYFVFQGFVDSVPGQWHGFAVIMGASSSVIGAGELFYWDYQGVAAGRSPITATSVAVAAADGTYYPMVNLGATSVMVATPAGVRNELPRSAPQLRLWPNPFNPRTTVSARISEAGLVRLAVYDLNGRKVTTLFDGEKPSGEFRLNWTGQDAGGQDVPSGVYLMRLTTMNGATTSKAILLR